MEEPKTFLFSKSVRDRRATWQAVLIGLILVEFAVFGTVMVLQEVCFGCEYGGVAEFFGLDT